MCSLSSTPAELAPLEDRSSLIISTTAPEGTTFDYMDKFMDKLISLIKKDVPENDGIISVTSPGFGASGSTNSGIYLSDANQPDQRRRTQGQIAGALTGEVNGLTEARTYVVQQQTIGQRGFGLPVQYVLQAPNFEKLREFLPKFVEAAQKDPTFAFVDVNLKFNKPELRVTIDRKGPNARNFGCGYYADDSGCVQRTEIRIFYQERKTIPGYRSG